MLLLTTVICQLLRHRDQIGILTPDVEARVSLFSTNSVVYLSAILPVTALELKEEQAS